MAVIDKAVMAVHKTFRWKAEGIFFTSAAVSYGGPL